MRDHAFVDDSVSRDETGLLRLPFVDHLTQGRAGDTRQQIFIQIAKFALELLQPDPGRVSLVAVDPRKSRGFALIFRNEQADMVFGEQVVLDSRQACLFQGPLADR
ncbi:hypothetical protein [Sphingomonas sp. Marseille-Q8236]